MSAVGEYVRQMKADVPVSQKKAGCVSANWDTGYAERIIASMKRCIAPAYHKAILQILTVVYVNELFRKTSKPYSLQQKHNFLTTIVARNCASREK